MSVRALARRIGVSHNLIHHYFGSKWQLWHAAMDHGLEKRAVEIVHILDITQASEADAVRAFSQALRRFILIGAQLPALARIMMREQAEGGARLDYLYAQYLKPMADAAIGFLERMRQGQAETINSRSFILLIASGALSLFSQAALAEKLGGPDPLSEEAIESHVRSVTHVILSGVLGEPNSVG